MGGPLLAGERRVCIIGCGAMGGLLAYAAYRSQRIPPTCIVRSPRQYWALKREGLRVEAEPHGETVIPVFPFSLGEADLALGGASCDNIIVSVKSPDAPGALRVASRLAGGRPVGVLLNGLLPLSYTGGPVYHVVAEYGAVRLGLNRVRLSGGRRIVTGPPPLWRGFEGVMGEACSLASVLSAAGLNAYCSWRIEYYAVLKNIVNSVINSITSILGVSNGFIVEDPHAWSLARLLAVEAARASQGILGVELDVEEIIGEVHDVAVATRSNKSSMLQDLEACRRTEADWILKPLINASKNNGYDAPRLETVYLLVKALEERGLRCGRRR